MNSEQKMDFLIELFQEFKKDVNNRLDRLEHNQERLEHNQQRLEDKQEKTDDLVRDIWKSRDSVKAKVTFDFIWKAVAVNSLILIGVGSFFFK
jgi:predicted nuclease with TOPRIM domain